MTPKKKSGSQDRLAALRREFEIPRGVAFLNHASFGPVPRRGRHAVEALLDRQGQFRGDPDVDDESFGMLDASHRMFAKLIGFDYRRVAFMPNASYGLNAILWGIDFTPGERILVCANEFPAAVYAVRTLAERRGMTVVPIPCPNGFPEMDSIQAELKRGAATLVISWVQFFNGFRNNLAGLAKMCHLNGCILVVDGSQGVGAIPLDMKKDRFDALACGAQKWLFGQTGSGFLAIAERTVRPIKPLYSGWLSYDMGYTFTDLQRWDLDPYEDGRFWEVGTYPYYSLRLAHAGLSILTECGLGNVYRHIQTLHRRLIDGLAGTRFRPIIFAPENRSAIIAIRGPRAKELYQVLTRKRVYTSLREGNIRVSPHFYNTGDQIDRLVEEVVRFDTARGTRK